MKYHRRTLSFDALEGRRLLSSAAGLRPTDVSQLARVKSLSVKGTIGGTTGFDHNDPANFNDVTAFFDGSGTLPRLGVVQMTTTIPNSPRLTQHGTMVLVVSEGTINFKVVEKRSGPLQLTVQNGTGAFAGYSGSGTLKVKITDPGYRHIFTTTNAFKLNLKT
jgi:hypothetical protein